MTITVQSTMKYFLYSGLVIGVALFNVLVSAKLTAVSEFDGLEDLYHLVRHRQNHQSKLFTTPLGLTVVCREIISTCYFGGHKNNFFTSLIKFASIYKKAYIVNNRTHEDIKENLLQCQTYEDDGPTFYVSQEYDLNMTYMSGQSHKYIAGRFIFEMRNKNFYLIALAEEPAKRSTISKYDLERHYLNSKTRKDYKPATDASKDPLCGLDGPRICNVILNSSNLVPYWAITTEPCEKMVVQLPNKYYREWILLCGRGSSPEYTYVSRAYNSNHLIGYERKQEGELKMLVLKDLYYNVGMVIDEPNVISKK